MTIETTVLALQEFVSHMMRVVPITLSVFSLFIGAGVGNVSYLFLALGLILIVPVVRAVTNPILGALCDALPGIKTHPAWYTIQPGADCNVLSGPAATSEYMIPSYWWAAVVFFGSYVVMNAVDMATVESPPDSPANRVQARKAHAGMAIVITVVLVAAMLIYRYTGGCETPVGAILGTLLYGGLGIAWFAALKSCTSSNMADLFGIASRLMPERDAQARGSICYPIA